MKYVMFQVDLGSGLKKLVPVIFPNGLVHAMVAEALTSYRDSHGDVVIDGKPVSAGDLSVDVGKCHGTSTTLKLSPKSDDSSVINCIDYMHGIVNDDPEVLDGLVDTAGLEPELAADVQALADERQIAETEARFSSGIGSLEDTLLRLRTLAMISSDPTSRRYAGRQRKKHRKVA